MSIEELKRIRDDARRTMTLRSGSARVKFTMHLGSCGIAAGAREVMVALLKEIEKQRLSDVIVTTSGCAGICHREPMATVEVTGQPPVRYANLKPDRILRVLREHVLEGRVVEEFTIYD